MDNFSEGLCVLVRVEIIHKWILIFLKGYVSEYQWKLYTSGNYTQHPKYTLITLAQWRRKIDNWGGQYSYIRVLHY